MPSHYLNQCWIIVNCTLGNKIQWNIYQNSHFFIQENTVKNAVCKMVVILSLSQCVKCMAGCWHSQHGRNPFKAGYMHSSEACISHLLAPWQECLWNCDCKTSNISHTLVGNEIVDHSDVVAASPVSAASTISSFSPYHLASMDWAKTTARQDASFKFWDLVWLILDVLL